MPIQPDNPFTPQAAKRWIKIPQWAQEKILANVFCGKCLGSVPIILEKAEMRDRDLILMGTCNNCGKKICRVVEPE
ncbi:MAG: hypothetical protein A2167_03915 [Planctomycetes bacterium RBG_13_46_10]|nr:MAG: hypothetical protein A2167_03915 [Planctomycetes bacterium RBG_13_46_10]